MIPWSTTRKPKGWLPPGSESCFGEKSPGYSQESFERVWNRIMMKYYQKFLDRELSFEEQQHSRMRELFDNPGMSPKTAGELFTRYLDLYEASWETYEDVVPFLTWCVSHNHPVSVLTDGSQKQQNRKLELTGLAPYFTYVFTAEEEKRTKPDPLFFTGVCEKLSAKPSDTIYIGDNREKDALGASQAGLTGIWLDRENRDSPFEGLRVTSLIRAISFLEEPAQRGEDYSVSK